MNHSNKLLILLLILNCLKMYGQFNYSEINENVFFHLGMRYSENSKKRKAKNVIPPHLPLILIIDNKSNDTLYINNFDYNIREKLDNRLFENARTFFWELLTVSNQIPDDIVIVSSGFSIKYVKKKFLFIKFKQNIKFIPEDNYVDIIIPPNSSFVADINLLLSSFMYYCKGYYKICLYYKDDDECIAELFIKNEKEKRI